MRFLLAMAAGCGRLSAAALACCAALACAALASAAAPAARPAPGARTFNSSAVEALLVAWQPRFLDADLGTIFANALPNTLDTTVQRASANDSFIITGDIPAMWLRDSANQVAAYFPLAAQDAALAALLRGVAMRQARSVLIDTYANAFNIEPIGAGLQSDPRTPPM